MKLVQITQRRTFEREDMKHLKMFCSRCNKETDFVYSWDTKQPIGIIKCGCQKYPYELVPMKVYWVEDEEVI